MSKTKENRKSGGARKIGRRKRAVNQAMSMYVKGKISFDSYRKQSK